MKFIKQSDRLYHGSKFSQRSLPQEDVVCHYNSMQVKVILKGIPNSILPTAKVTAIKTFFNFNYAEL